MNIFYMFYLQPLTFNFSYAILNLVIAMLNINVSNLYKVFQDFYTLTNMKVVLFNKEQEVLMEYPAIKNTFCNIIANDSYWFEKCRNCDRLNIDACCKTEKISKYSCHLGLSEAIIPIYDINGILGYLMVGQVLLKDNSEKTKKLMKEQFDEKKFASIGDAIEKIPVKSSAELEACVTVLQAFTTYILSNQWVTPQRSEFIRHMDKFIENNLEKNITVDDICAEFHIRRTRLYSVAKNYLGCTIASYIRKQRIHHACRMLCETDEPISRIAEKVGFLDYGHFSRIFKQQQGITATSYRSHYQTNLK